MPSSFSASLRFELQFSGENINLWGDKLNVVLNHADYATAGWLTKPLTSDYALTTANAADDEARAAMLKFTGTGPFAVTIPSVSKAYDIWNACTGALTVKTGAGTTVVLDPGEIQRVICDGSNVKRSQGTNFSGQQLTNIADPTTPQGASTKAYADALAFTANAGILPGQGGNAGKVLGTDGSVASWGLVLASSISGLSANAAAVRVGTTTSTALTPGDTYNAFAVVALTYAATVTPDLSTFINASITLTGNLTLANPTNPKVGQVGFIELIQDATGSRLLSAVGSNWKRSGGVPTLTTTTNATDVLVYQVLTSAFILYDLIRNPT